MKKIRILVAEDTKEARDIITDNLRDYELEKYGNNDTFDITKAESFVKADQILEDYRKNNNPYEVFFCDIDFTEDRKGGKRDSGFQLIRKAFEISNLTHIYTYSGQFKAADLWEGYEELLSKGLVIKTFDKSHTDGGDIEWVNKNFEELFNRLEKEKVLWDIWANHNIFKESVANAKFSSDPIENMGFQYEIISNLESILYLLKKTENLDAEKIIHRLVIQLYHRCLELFCRGVKTDQEILSASNRNQPAIAKLIGKSENWEIGNKVTALTTIVSFTPEYYAKAGYKVNFYRNSSVHPNEFFDVGLSNVLYCSIALALYANKGKWDGIKTGEIEAIAKNSEGKGNRDLLELLYSRR